MGIACQTSSLMKGRFGTLKTSMNILQAQIKSYTPPGKLHWEVGNNWLTRPKTLARCSTPHSGVGLLGSSEALLHPPANLRACAFLGQKSQHAAEGDVVTYMPDSGDTRSKRCDDSDDFGHQ